MVMIAAVAGAVKWFGSRRKGDEGATGQGDDPIVKALFKAVNQGDLDDFLALVDDDCRISVNSYEITRNGKLDRGPKLFADALGDMRTASPDVHWELYDELTGKDEGKHKIAIRFVSTATIDGEKDELEVACWGVVEDDKLTEWHQTADQESYDRRRERTGEDALGDDSDST